MTNEMPTINRNCAIWYWTNEEGNEIGGDNEAVK